MTGESGAGLQRRKRRRLERLEENGVLEPDRPVEVMFEDRGPESVQTAFRSIE